MYRTFSAFRLCFILLLSSSLSLASERASESAPPVKEVTLVAKEFSFSKDTIRVAAGDKLKLILNNGGVLSHNVSFEDKEVGTETVQSGHKTSITVSFDKPGRYKFVCSVPGHAKAGMKGTVIVE